MSVLVTKPAPEFTTVAVMPDNSFNENFKLSDYQGKYVVLFFYPLDFTFVCPSEIIAFDHRLDEFKSRNVEVIGVSIDSHFSHLAWKNTPIDKGGIGNVQYPLVADISKEITRTYDVETAPGIALRGSFLIDKAGVVRHQVVNDLPLGRNIDEMLRLIDALQFTEKHGEVCPAGWQKGKPGMKGSTEGVAEYLAQHANEL
uniref:Thioredoxin peroxidase n=1 Tax=Candidatus Kentrum sp. TUN TaxID=2126343 RepID=A0A450ZYM7_9GAMM|nr:MAG: peroxiredoxin (alkyl hydroperoxide reductase subunit C) [Candidatus Kentron sp. TUN]VFK58856.1 MAG: peroxiredoxin (alkyl hydroperoxide reductase subunit C) [Candidatus Kentron sp. TUN]VFK62695.1 MAG: peroxiredoxin (alkyl hydroperoxide reductase subunit C) [Candidatus Kentron sp. TUN]